MILHIKNKKFFNYQDIAQILAFVVAHSALHRIKHASVNKFYRCLRKPQ